jgi:6-phosphogluconolactonase (cycloisomerase 2 family)
MLNLKLRTVGGMKLFVPALLCLATAGVAWADGTVYAMTNALGNNQIVAYHRASNGNLTLIQTIATGGGGSGLQLSGVDSLGSAGGLQLDQAHHLLFAVNTETISGNNGSGSYNSDCNQGTITSFLVASDGVLTFADRVPSGGLFPNSLTLRRRGKGGNGADTGNLLYVLNGGGPGNCNVSPNITGFRVNASGLMQPVGSTQDIDPGPPAGTGENCVDDAGFATLTSAPAADFACGLNPPSFPRSPAQVRFTPDGNQLIVTVKGTNSIYVFPVNANERAGSPTVTQSSLPALPTYFGFTFDKNANLLVTEMFGSAANIPTGGQGAVSSFMATGAGNLVPISSHVGDGGTAPGSIAIEPLDGNYVYVANNLSASISSYSVGADGSVTLLSGTAFSGTGPNDLATASEGGTSFLYVLDAGSGSVGAFQISRTDGSLSAITGGCCLPVATQGLAAF